jgi:hypothetical protein
MPPSPAPFPIPEAAAWPQTDSAAAVPLGRALVAQAAAVLIVAVVAVASAPVSFSLFGWALLQGAIAALLGRRLGLDPWWLGINALFVPGLVCALALDLPPYWALSAFLLLASMYAGVTRSRVPLFLSSRVALAAVANLLPHGRSFSFVDLGCGTGGVLRSLSRARPLGRFRGFESAPLPILISRFRAGRRADVAWRDFWSTDLGNYDVVYAYLSPAPMPVLWRKARSEMRPGSLFISNAFEVPGVDPTLTIESSAPPAYRLYVWRM